MSQPDYPGVAREQPGGAGLVLGSFQVGPGFVPGWLRDGFELWLEGRRSDWSSDPNHGFVPSHPRRDPSGVPTAVPNPRDRTHLPEL
jgi:hypothetical protein